MNTNQMSITDMNTAFLCIEWILVIIRNALTRKKNTRINVNTLMLCNYILEYNARKGGLIIEQSNK